MSHQKRKIVMFILPNLSNGGAERVTLNMIRGLDKGRFKPILFLLNNSGVYGDEIPPDTEVHVGIHSGGGLKRYLPRLIWKLVRVARKSDLVIGALEQRATYYAYIAGKIAKKPVLGWVHTNLSQTWPLTYRKQRVLNNFIYPRLNRIVTVSNGAKQGIESVIPAVRGKVDVFYNPLPISWIRKMALEADEEKFHTPTFVAVGRLHYQKGLDTLCQAHALVKKKGINHRLAILGEGPYRTKLEHLIRELGIEDSVQLYGFRKNPFPLISQAKALVLSSRIEGLPTVLLESMSLGVPVISTKCHSGPEEILMDGKYGILVPVDDPLALAGAMESILADSHLHDELSMLGRARSNMFDFSATIPKIENYLLRLSDMS